MADSAAETSQPVGRPWQRDAMFSPGERRALKQRILEHAVTDTQIIGCALLGSAARDEEDPWSDIDVALEIAEGAEPTGVAERWSNWVAGTVDVADTLDMYASGAMYRVFLLSNSMQVDLSFWPHGELRPIGGPLRMRFGEARPPGPDPAPTAATLIRRGWLYALHARAAVARGRAWQAEMMLGDLRNQVIALGCLRHGVDPTHGRGADHLPADQLQLLDMSRPSNLKPVELRRSFRATLDLFRVEIACHDTDTATALDHPLKALEITQPSAGSS